MFGIKQWLAPKPLDLDIHEDEVGVEWVMDAEIGSGYKREATLLIRLVLDQAMGDNACAVMLAYDDEDDCYRMLYCLPDDAEDAYLGWFEMVPPVNYLGKEMIRQLRRRAGLKPGAPTGTFQFEKNDHSGEIACRSLSPNEIVLFLTERRPRLIDKRTGDRPGCPWTDFPKARVP